MLVKVIHRKLLAAAVTETIITNLKLKTQIIALISTYKDPLRLCSSCKYLPYKTDIEENKASIDNNYSMNH